MLTPPDEDSALEITSTGATAGQLYVVGTPIGNLSDFSERACATLRDVDLILAEDTRVSATLLTHYGIGTPLRALHAHNEAKSVDALIAEMWRGRRIALIADAGTPAISDPGATLIAAAHAAAVRVVPIPGPNAAITALSAAGIEGPFLFLGFLPAKPAQRRKSLSTWKSFAHTLVFYEAPHRVEETLVDLAQILGADRNLVLARELTKRYETVHRCALGEGARWLAADPNRTRGEFVLIVSGAQGVTSDAAANEAAQRILSILLRELPLRQAVSLAAEISGARRNDLYERALTITRASE